MTLSCAGLLGEHQHLLVYIYGCKYIYTSKGTCHYEKSPTKETHDAVMRTVVCRVWEFD